MKSFKKKNIAVLILLTGTFFVIKQAQNSSEDSFLPAMKAPEETISYGAFFKAMANNNVQEVKKFLAMPDLDINYCYYDRDTALIHAIKWGHKEVVELLLADKKTDVNAQDERGVTALMWASDGGTDNGIEMTKLLLARPEININLKDAYGTTLLMFAGPEIAELLLARPEIEVNSQDDNGYTALSRAGDLYSYDKKIELLLSHPNVDVNIQNECGDTILIDAARCGAVKLVERLLAKPETDVTIRNNNGKTALMCAIEESCDPRTVKLLSSGNPQSLDLWQKIHHEHCQDEQCGIPYDLRNQREFGTVYWIKNGSDE